MKKSLPQNISLMFALFISSAITIANTPPTFTPLKIALEIPDGTGLALATNKMAEELKQNSQGRINLLISYNGIQGNEKEILQKILKGELQGGILTGKTLGLLISDIRALEIPFNFLNQNPQQISQTFSEFSTLIEKSFPLHQGKILTLFEMGPVYMVSTKKIVHLQDLSTSKVWSWDDDPIISALLELLKPTIVSLPIEDVLSHLTSGGLDAAYATPIGILALQWNTTVKYLLNLPIAHSVGGLIISSKAWKMLSALDKKIFMQTAKKFQQEITTTGQRDHQEALQVLVGPMLEKVNIPASDIKRLPELRQEVINKLRLKHLHFSASIMKKVKNLGK